jgi:hypothetical protein
MLKEIAAVRESRLYLSIALDNFDGKIKKFGVSVNPDWFPT